MPKALHTCILLNYVNFIFQVNIKDIYLLQGESHHKVHHDITNVFPVGVNALRRNSYEAKYIPVAGTSVKIQFTDQKN